MAGLSDSHGWQPDDEIIGHVSDSFQGHVLAALNRPFIVLFEQQRADETGYGLLVGEDTDDIRASLDLAVEAFNWILCCGAWCDAPWGSSYRPGRPLRSGP
jgi:hypothetical protein